MGGTSSGRGRRARAIAISVAGMAALAAPAGTATAADTPVSARETQELGLTGPFIPDRSADLAKGFYVSGSCQPDCVLTTELRIGRHAARRIGTPPLLISKDSLWLGDFNQVRVRPGSAARYELKRYSGKPFRLAFKVWAEHLDANGDVVRSGIARADVIVKASN